MTLNARYGPVVDDVLVIVRAHVQAEEEEDAAAGSEKASRLSAGEMEA